MLPKFVAKSCIFLDQSISNLATKSDIFVAANSACRKSLDKYLSGMMLCSKPELMDCIVSGF